MFPKKNLMFSADFLYPAFPFRSFTLPAAAAPLSGALAGRKNKIKFPSKND